MTSKTKTVRYFNTRTGEVAVTKLTNGSFMVELDCEHVANIEHSGNVGRSGCARGYSIKSTQDDRHLLGNSSIYDAVFMIFEHPTQDQINRIIKSKIERRASAKHNRRHPFTPGRV